MLTRSPLSEAVNKIGHRFQLGLFSFLPQTVNELKAEAGTWNYIPRLICVFFCPGSSDIGYEIKHTPELILGRAADISCSSSAFWLVRSSKLTLNVAKKG